MVCVCVAAPDIVRKYPDLHVLDIDSSSVADERRRTEEESAVWDKEEDVQQPAVFITVRIPTEEKAVHCSSPVSSIPTNSSYTSIVRQRLARYLD